MFGYHSLINHCKLQPEVMLQATWELGSFYINVANSWCRISSNVSSQLPDGLFSHSDVKTNLADREGGVDTNWDGHHDGGVVGRGGQFPLSAKALSVWVFLNNLH